MLRSKVGLPPIYIQVKKAIPLYYRQLVVMLGTYLLRQSPHEQFNNSGSVNLSLNLFSLFSLDQEQLDAINGHI